MKILHISDLHFGPYFCHQAAESLLVWCEKHEPNMILVSGDLTQRARSSQFRQCASYFENLRRICPVIAIPGNHDIPLYRFFERLNSPYDLYRKYISQELSQMLLPVPEIAIAALNTTHPTKKITNFHWNEGEFLKAANFFSQTETSCFRVLVVHQNPFATPNFSPSKIADFLATNRIHLLLSGHTHESFVFAVNSGSFQSIRAGCGTTLSTRGRGRERGQNSLMVYTWHSPSLSMERFSLAVGGSEFSESGSWEFT
jgi:predicted MPP superfamily phosphohydrolase